jgi:hypothetical protein
MPHRLVLVVMDEVQYDPKLLGGSGHVPISEWSGWQFKSCYEIFFLLDGGKKN